MKLADFDFDLPEDLIATRPVKPRSSSKLLVAVDDQIQDRSFRDIVDILRSGDLLILNDTKVIPARLFGTRTRSSAQGIVTAKVEVTLIAPQQNGQWAALVKPLRKIKEGETIVFSDVLSASVVDKQDGQAILKLHAANNVSLDDALDQTGAMPLPPYIASKRPADEQDKDDYQTVWAKNSGAVAAPTASLHFDDSILKQLTENGVQFGHVTLHVGAGTFLPVKVEDVTTHKMHAEWGEVTPEVAAKIAHVKANGGRVIAVGTTALRLIETAARKGEIQPWTGDTDIFIYPGFEFNVTDGLITNFHLPQSTLLMLVAALMGKTCMDRIYDHAIEKKYRFFSYGDASILLPNKDNI